MAKEEYKQKNLDWLRDKAAEDGVSDINISMRMDSKRIDVVPAGGLANRMRAIAAAVSLAQKTGMDCRVWWRECRELRAQFADLFEAPPVIELPFQLSEIKSAWSYFFMSPPRKKNLYLSGVVQNLKYRLRMMDNMNMEGYRENPEALLRDLKGAKGDVYIFSGLPFYPFSEDLYRDLFKFSAQVERRARDLSDGIGQFDYGIHIRQTDNHISIVNSPIEIFERKIEELLSQDPKVRIFLATDSHEVKERLGRKYLKNITYNHRPAKRDSYEGMLDGAAEMLILSRTGRIFGSYWSSYSEAAAMLGKVPLEIMQG